MILRWIRKFWWGFRLRGFFATLFGVSAFFWPLLELGLFVYFFGVFVFIDGFIVFIAALINFNEKNCWVLLLEGYTGIFLAVLLLFFDVITVKTLLNLITIWAIVTGTLQIVFSLRLHKEMQGEGVMFLNGLIPILFGLTLVFNPGKDASSFFWSLGIYSTIFGILLMILSFRVLKMATNVKNGQS